jgi:D-amino-acid dehydrogenase
MYDVVVVGGGLVGISTAYHLVRQGAKTLLLDRQDTGRATDAGAGILSPETSTAYPETWFNFAVEAVNYYSVLIDQLQAEQAGETGYARCGKLTVAVSEDEIEPFEQAKELIFKRQKHRGLPSTADLYSVSSGEARGLFPALAPVYGAIYYRQAARVDGRLLSQALSRAAQQRDLVVRQVGVDQLLVVANKVTGVIANGEHISTGNVVIAGGAWSQAFGRQVGVQIPVEPQRGQIIHLALPETNTAAWPIISAFRGHYMLTWPASRVVVGASRETGSGFKPYPTASGINEVLSEALRVAPGLAAAQIIEIRVGLRPLTTDKLPILGAIPGIDNIFLATGHGPTGLQLGPYSGKIITDLIIGNKVTTDISAFSVTRFRV